MAAWSQPRSPATPEWPLPAIGASQHAPIETAGCDVRWLSYRRAGCHIYAIGWTHYVMSHHHVTIATATSLVDSRHATRPRCCRRHITIRLRCHYVACRQQRAGHMGYISQPPPPELHSAWPAVRAAVTPKTHLYEIAIESSLLPRYQGTAVLATPRAAACRLPRAAIAATGADAGITANIRLHVTS